MSEIWDLLLHMLQEASRWPQDRSRWLSGRNFGPNLSPRWLQVASRWAQVGTKIRENPIQQPTNKMIRLWTALRSIFKGFLIDFCSILHRCLIDFLDDFSIDFWKMFGLPRFCVRLIVQRSPAVLPLCGLNTAGEPASFRPSQPFGYMAI